MVKADHKPLSERTKSIWKLVSTIPLIIEALSQFSYQPSTLDDADACNGVPAAIQILGRALEEEKLLSVAQIVADAIREYQS